MKVYYKKSIISQVEDTIMEAKRLNKIIDFIELNKKEWGELIAIGKRDGFRDTGLLFLRTSHIEYMGVNLIEEV